MKLVVAGYSHFLWYAKNPTEMLLKKIEKKGILTILLPVGYFKRDMIKPLKEYKPSIYIIIGMWEGDYCKIETVANNGIISLKNPWLRFFVKMYSYVLKWQGKNVKVKKQIPQEKLTIVPIDKSAPKKIQLHTKIPRLSGIKRSTNPAFFVCNYAIWVVERYIQRKKLKTKFYFIHIPKKVTRKHEEHVMRFIQNF